MSARPIEQKQRRRVAKTLRRRPLPAYIDLVEWLVARGHAPTKRAARDLILAKRVRSESHTLGVQRERVPGPKAMLEYALGREVTMVEEDVVQPLVPANLRDTIIVLP
jgi:hypothetical protein